MQYKILQRENLAANKKGVLLNPGSEPKPITAE